MSAIDWREWHDRYDTWPMLQQRLAIVQREIVRVLDENDRSPLRVVSMCAGDGRDLLGALEHHTRRDVSGRLVEIDPGIAADARAHAAALGLANLDVLTGDAGETASYEGLVPADLVLVCGVLGNMSDADVERTVRALPMFAAQGATVIWTRTRRSPDLTVDIRRWLAETGFQNEVYEALPEEATVGTARFTGETQALRPEHLFTFNRESL